MIAARFRARLPAETWIATVSQAMPEATFRLLSSIRTGDTAVELGEATADDPAAVATAIADQESIVSWTVLETTDRRLLATYETTDTDFYDLVADSSLPVTFPVVVRNGWYELDLTGTREEFDRLRDALEAAGRPYELLSLVHEEETGELLTDRQRELLTVALRRGYFEVPRECTLAELAATVGIDKSTASRILRRGAGQVLRWHLTGDGSGRIDRRPE